MKSLYFQTVGIECKFYENQQLEYRLYSWGQSVFENYSHNLHAPLRGIFCPNSVVVARYGAFIVTYILQKTFFKHAQRTEKLHARILFKYGFYCP